MRQADRRAIQAQSYIYKGWLYNNILTIQIISGLTWSVRSPCSSLVLYREMLYMVDIRPEIVSLEISSLEKLFFSIDLKNEYSGDLNSEHLNTRTTGRH